MQLEQAVKMSAQLYECRDAAKRLLGAHYQRDMDLWAMAIRGVAENEKCSDIAAATKMAKDAGGFGAIVILAAVVEMTEPSNGAVRGASRPAGEASSAEGATSTVVLGTDSKREK